MVDTKRSWPGSPLYGRLDWRCRLEAFDYWDAAKFVDWPPRDKVQLYAAFGGTPKYLDAVESSTDIESNIVSLMLASDGPVRMQVETAIEQEEGLRDVASSSSSTMLEHCSDLPGAGKNGLIELSKTIRSCSSSRRPDSRIPFVRS